MNNGWLTSVRLSISIVEPNRLNDSPVKACFFPPLFVVGTRLLVSCAAILLIAVPAPSFAKSADCAAARALLATVVADNNNSYDLLGRSPPGFPTVHERALYGTSKTIPLPQNSDAWRLGWGGEPPPANLIAEWYAMPYRSISVCFGGLSKSALLLKDVLGPKWRPAPQRKPLSEVRMTYPALNAGRSEALLLYETAYIRGLGGGLELIFLRRDRGKWRKAGSRLLAQY